MELKKGLKESVLENLKVLEKLSFKRFNPNQEVLVNAKVLQSDYDKTEVKIGDKYIVVSNEDVMSKNDLESLNRSKEYLERKIKEYEKTLKMTPPKIGQRVEFEDTVLKEPNSMFLETVIREGIVLDIEERENDYDRFVIHCEERDSKYFATLSGITKVLG